jgi:glutaredoxin
MGLWWFWQRRRPRSSANPLHLVMYTRGGCHLCDTAWELLQERQKTYEYNLEAVDVDADSDLAARYGAEVPIVMVNGMVRFRGKVNEVLLDRLLRAEAGRKS